MVTTADSLLQAACNPRLTMWLISIAQWSRPCLNMSGQLAYHHQGRGTNETTATGFHAHRTDDRSRDHRHSGGGRAAGVSGLHGAGEDVGSDSRHERVPHLRY